MRNLIIIHRNLGHPSNKLLQRILREADAPRDVIAMAGELRCSLCHRFRQIEPARPSTTVHARQFNETLCIDMAYHNIKDDRKALVIHFVDEASRFHITNVVKEVVMRYNEKR